MSEVIKRYTFFAYLDDDVAELDCYEEEDGAYVLASDYDRDTKALEDKARSQHARDSAELRDLCSQRDGFKAELWRVKEELSELKHVMAESLDNYRAMLHASEAQVSELKAKSSGVVLPERKAVPELMMASYHEAIAHNACLDEVARLNASPVTAGGELRSVLSMILSALDRDAAEGKTVRGEMAEELRALLATAQPAADGERDGFERYRIAIKFCEARGIAEDSPHRSIVVDAFCSGYGFGLDSAAQPAQASAWVPVSERLPEIDMGAPEYARNVQVIGWREGWREPRQLCYNSNGYAKTEKGRSPRWEELRGCLAFSEPTHWQPLPTAPTPGASDGKENA